MHPFGTQKHRSRPLGQHCGGMALPNSLSELLAIYLYREMVKYHDFGAASATGWLMLMFSLFIAVPYLRRMFQSVVRGA